MTERQEIKGGGEGVPQPTVGLTVSKDEIGTALAIHLSQNQASRAVWAFEVYAQTQEGEFFLGKFTTRPPYAPSAGDRPAFCRGDLPARTVALAYCPGVTDWRVVPSGPLRETAILKLTTSKISLAGVFGIVAVNGSRVADRIYPVAPSVPAQQAQLSNGPGKLFLLYGFTDPAQGLTYIGPVDKASPIVNGDLFAAVPVQLPAGGANFSFSFEPDGLPFANQIRWAASGTPGVIALLPLAFVQAKVG